MKHSKTLPIVIQKLKEIANGTLIPPKQSEGLCIFLTDYKDDLTPEENVAIAEAIFNWPEAGKSRIFPVGNGVQTYRHYRVNHLNMYEGEYGEKRKRLAGYIAKELEKYFDVK